MKKNLFLVILCAVVSLVLFSCDSSQDGRIGGSCTIILHPNNGNSDIVYKGKQGDSVTLPIPYKEDQPFAYWYDANNNQYYGGNGFAYSSTATLELWGRWNVTIDLPEDFDDIHGYSGLSIELPELGGYCHQYWYDENGNIYYPGKIICPMENTQLLHSSKHDYGDQLVCKICKAHFVGPAGGYVFYDKGYYSDGWRYLEAAPADLRVVDGVPTVDSSVRGYSSAQDEYIFGFCRTSDNGSNLYVNGTTTYDVSDCTGTEVGTGKSNTQLLVSAMGMKTYSTQSGLGKTEEYAARLCDILSYTVNGVTFDDWFLPSQDELILMYNLKRNGLGNFAYAFYWSSSEHSDYADNAFGSHFDLLGVQEYGMRNFNYSVRPVRAF